MLDNSDLVNLFYTMVQPLPIIVKVLIRYYHINENGKAFIRMNVACPFERLKDGLNRFKEGIYLYQNK